MTVHEHVATTHPEPIEINDGYREWYESCPCCMSKAAPEIKQALDEEKAGARPSA